MLCYVQHQCKCPIKLAHLHWSVLLEVSLALDPANCKHGELESSFHLPLKSLEAHSWCHMEGFKITCYILFNISKIHSILNYPIYAMHYSNLSIQTCKLNYKEIWTHIDDLGQHTHISRHMILISLPLLVGCVKYGFNIKDQILGVRTNQHAPPAL